MGNPMTWLTSSVSTGFAFLQSWKEQEAMREDAKNGMDELTRQQKEVNLRAQEQRSDRARQGDKQFASAMVAMEALGGGGSQDESRVGGEISGNAGLDLARIEGNRQRSIFGLQAEKNSLKKRTVRAIKASQANFFMTANKNAANAFGGTTADSPQSTSGIGTASWGDEFGYSKSNTGFAVGPH